MKLRMLAKDNNSQYGGCPSVYVGDSGELVVQGYQVDAATWAEVADPLPGEIAVRIAPEIVLAAADKYRATQGQ